MSLNGLDASAVVEAHQAALAEPGRWFLLKYVNRDTVELLSHGSGGVVEAKNVIEQYEEKSPLYGMINFRRKKVLLKYVPVGTSRLLQVRLTVQFQSVADAFPQDTVFSFSAVPELSESALGLAAMLQPSTHGSSLASSAASIKHRRLDEISEDAEEQVVPAQRDIATPATVSVTSEPVTEHTPTQTGNASYDSLPASALRAKALLARRKESELASDADSALSHPRDADRLMVNPKNTYVPSLDKSLPATPITEQSPQPPRFAFPKRHDSIPTPPVPPKSELRSESRSQQRPTRELNANEYPYIEPETESVNEPHISFDHMAQQLHHSNHLSPNESESISQWNNQVAAYTAPRTQPKKKLAPRPHVDTHRPPSSNTVAMPTTVRASSRQGAATPVIGYRPGSQQSSRSVPGRFPADQGLAPPIPNPHMASLYRDPESPKPPSVVSSNITETTSNVTPEKMRLMRALQMRKRSQILAQRSATSQSSRPLTSLDERLEPEAKNLDSKTDRLTPQTPPMQQGATSPATVNHVRVHDSNTASPASTTTASGTQSTKPSSISGEADKVVSPRTSSGNTELSATPKATQDREDHPFAQSAIDVVQVLDEATKTEGGNAKTHEPKSSVDEAFLRLTGATEPEIPQTVVQPSSPMDEDEKAEIDGLDNLESNRTLHSTLKLPPRVSSHGALLGRNSKHLTLQSNARSSAYNSIYSDNSLMAEIEYATFHEAKPVQVAYTPATPTMRKLSSDKIREMTRSPAPESPQEPKSPQPEKVKPRSASLKSTSTAQQQFTSDEPLPPLTNKASLGTSISKRIKALEVLTHREPAHAQPTTSQEPSGGKSTFANMINRASFMAQFHVTKHTPEPPPDTKPDVDPPRTATGTETADYNVRALVQRQGEEAELFAPSRKGETVSVTARIVREQRRPATSATVRNHENGLNLHRSPLIVEHGRHPSDPASMSTMSRDISARSIDTYSSVTTDKPRKSFSSFRSSSTVRQFLSEGRTSRMSFMSKKGSHAPSEASSIGDDKKSNRANRIMKRMSGLGSRFGSKSSKFGASKDQVPQQETILEQVEDDRRSSVADSMLQMIDIGDVNVQFPETLLWKRRFMRIDDQGFLIFSAPTDNEHIRTAHRKFHLAELKIPTLPDREREEMSWSILLDLKKGGCVQCACESRNDQESILKMLVDAHYAYNSMYDAV